MAILVNLPALTAEELDELRHCIEERLERLGGLMGGDPRASMLNSLRTAVAEVRSGLSFLVEQEDWPDVFSGFVADMKRQGIHVGVNAGSGDPTVCATCGTPWPCSRQRSRLKGPS